MKYTLFLLTLLFATIAKSDEPIYPAPVTTASALDLTADYFSVYDASQASGARARQITPTEMRTLTASNLTGTASPTNYVMANSNGTGVTLSLATGTNAGLLAPADFTKLGILDATTDANKPVSTAQATAIAAAQAAAIAASQPLDSDLTAIAALSTTSYGRAVLALADAAALRAAAGTGTIATQSAAAVAITGGTIAGTTIGNNTYTISALTGGTVLDFAGDPGKTYTLAGNTTFTTNNLASGKPLTLYLTGGVSTFTLTWPAWKPQGSALPVSLAAGKTATITIVPLGTTDAACRVYSAIEP